jgi:hypothetical protein
VQNDEDLRIDVLRLCAATHAAMGNLALPASAQADLLACLQAAENAAPSSAVADADAMMVAVKRVRYVLVEAADGPIAAVLADSAARIVGDGIGRMFS